MSAKEHVVEIHVQSQVIVYHFNTKKDAMTAGTEYRRCGMVAYVFPTTSPFRSGK